MRNGSFLPDSDAELVVWGQTFNTVATNNLTTLKISATELKAFSDALSAFSVARTDATNKRNAAKAATVAQNTTKKSFETVARTFNARIQGTTGVPDSLKTELGLTVRKPRSLVNPIVPLDLVVNGYQDGNNILKWKPNGNAANTKYLIEAKQPDGDWLLVDSVTSVSYIHEGQTPGVQIAYRVRAKRRNVFSPYSTVAVAYDTPAPVLVMAKAA